MAKNSCVETLLNNARETLQGLGEAIEVLEKTFPELFENPDLSTLLQSFKSVYQEAVERLQFPRLSIATIGTTSSGKSTIVNALIGRKIAPMEAGEMSGGVLAIRHAEELGLVVEATQGAAWETGNWNDLTDEKIYTRIRDKVMVPYHEARLNSKKSPAAPQVTVTCPILPVQNPALLGLPAGVGIEFIDLPGLKSVQDRTNLSVIQERVRKSFSLVALDYLQVDDEHRRTLLKELKEVVNAMYGRADDAAIFVLNRVDQRGGDDYDLTSRIELLKREIQQELELAEPPDILPFQARILYHIQCAWGVNSLYEGSSTSELVQNQLLNNFFNQCMNLIWQKCGDDHQLMQWFFDLGAKVKKGDKISQEDFAKLLDFAYEWSGGKALWELLKRRVEESWQTIVLRPILLPVIQKAEVLTSGLETFSQVKKLETKEEIKAAKQEVKQARKNLQKTIDNIEKDFQGNIRNKIDSLKKAEVGEESRLEQSLEAESLHGFRHLIEAIKEVEIDLLENIVIPVRDALNSNSSSYELKDKLQDFVGGELAYDIGYAYDLVSRELPSFEKRPGSLVKSVRAEAESDAVKQLEVSERSVIKLYFSLRKGLTVYAEYLLQAKIKKLEDALESITRQAEEKLFSACPNEISNFNIKGSILAAYRDKLNEEPPTLPENLFKFSNPSRYQSFSQEEVIGQKEVSKTVKSGSCFESKRTIRVKENIRESVNYYEIALPSIELMAKQWSAGIKKAEPVLWDTFRDWIVKQLEVIIDLFNQSVEEVLNLAISALEEQILVLNKSLEEERKKWKLIDARNNVIRNRSEKLKAALLLERV